MGAKPDLGAMLAGGPKAALEEDSGDDGELEVAAEDLIAAIEAGDAAGVASALRSAHEICRSYDMDE
jgi:hypothetical protein